MFLSQYKIRMLFKIVLPAILIADTGPHRMVSLLIATTQHRRDRLVMDLDLLRQLIGCVRVAFICCLFQCTEVNLKIESCMISLYLGPSHSRHGKNNLYKHQ